MPSNQAVRGFEQFVWYGIGALVVLGLVFGFAFENWALVETWIPVIIVALLIYLFYRLVLAVEHIAYDS